MDKLPKIALVLGLVAVLFSGVVVSGCSEQSQSSSPEVGKLAPDFRLSSLDGNIVSLSDFRGKAVLINFWASWCPACKFEMPFLQMIHEEWSEKGLVILAVDIGESQSEVQEFMANLGLSFTALLDSKKEVALTYNIRNIPTTFFVDKNGVIRDVKIGSFSTKAEIENRLGKIVP